MEALLADVERLRVSALTRAALLSPQVCRATLGPGARPRAPSPPAQPARPVPPRPARVPTAPRSERARAALLRRGEAERSACAGAVFAELLERMVALRAQFAERYWRRQSEECERRARRTRERALLALREREDAERAFAEERSDETVDDMNRILEEQSLASDRFAAITDAHSGICAAYNEIAETLQKKNGHVEKIYNKYVNPLNDIVTDIYNVMDVCKSGVISEKEVEMANILLSNILNLRDRLSDEITAMQDEEKRLIEEEEKRLIQEEEKRLIEEEQNKRRREEESKKEEEQRTRFEQAQTQAITEEAPARTANLPKTVPLFYSSKNYEDYRQLKSYLQNYESSYKELISDTTLKKFRFDCQKAVNIPLNAVSSVSGVHMRDKYDKLSKLLNGDRIQVMDVYISATQHPQGAAYCTALMAKKIVRQGALLVSSNPEAAFPLASVTVALWARFPDLGRLIEANFHRDCPYLVPMFLPQKEGQSDQDFYKSRGYTYNDEGIVEKQDKFLTRMSGIFRLCCAIWIAKPPRIMSTSNPHGLKYAWKWLASFINLKPEPDICATLLFDFFTVCGSECFKYYGRHFTKVIKLICMDYLPILQNIDEGGPKTRLEIFLQDVLKTGVIPEPSGVIPHNAW